MRGGRGGPPYEDHPICDVVLFLKRKVGHDILLPPPLQTWRAGFLPDEPLLPAVLNTTIFFCRLLFMKNILAIDIGAGTMDIMCYVPEEKMHYKAVVKSPVRTMAADINATSGDLLVTGAEMGGGPVTDALRLRTRSATVMATSSAAATLHHHPSRVEAMGIRIVDDDRVEAMGRQPNYTRVELKDIDPVRIEQIVEGFGLPYEFDAVAVCAQDHGVAPPGVSHLDFRHQLFKERLDRAPYPHTLLYPADKLPPAFNRLKSIVAAAAQLPTRAVYVMDSGMAAILGAGQDLSVQDKQVVMVLDIATSHTVAAVLNQGELWSSFEYHTHDITLPRLEQLLRDLADGNLDHTRILAEGGHGAYLRKAPGFDKIEAIVATGPKRRLMTPSELPITWGAPWGDNMMTGCVGLMEAMVRARGQASPGFF